MYCDRAMKFATELGAYSFAWPELSLAWLRIVGYFDFFKIEMQWI